MNTKTKTLILNLYNLADTPEEAVALLQDVLSQDISKLWKEHQKDYARRCVNCGRSYLVPRVNSPEYGFCSNCDNDIHRSELVRVLKQNRRANREGKRHDLTFREWMETLQYFGFKCAYCGKPYTDLEHFIPLSKCRFDNGTTKKNCLPSCSACNYFKRSKNPTIKRSARKIRISPERLNKVQEYLNQYGYKPEPEG